MYSSLKINNRLFSFEALKQAIEKENLFDSGIEWERNLALFLNEWLNDKTYVTGKTSGSTGVPKEIRLSKKAMIASALQTNAFFGLQENDKILLCLSANYIAGKMMIVRAIVGGFNLILSPPGSAPKWTDSVDFTAMVPMQIQSLLATEEGRARLCMAKKIIIGGSPVSESLENEIRKLPIDSYLTYGMTETVSHVALSRIEKKAPSNRIYNALPDVTFRTDDRDCLVISAPYLQAEPFITNDVVKLLSGTSFSWLGRWDNVINSGGIKLFPEEIERKISDLIDSRFYITYHPHKLLGQQVALKIESPSWDEATKTLLLKRIAPRLTKYEMPKQILFVDKFEETMSGKIKRE